MNEFHTTLGVDRVTAILCKQVFSFTWTRAVRDTCKLDSSAPCHRSQLTEMVSVLSSMLLRAVVSFVEHPEACCQGFSPVTPVSSSPSSINGSAN